MKKEILILTTVLMLFASCDLEQSASDPASVPAEGGLWLDSASVVSNLDLDKTIPASKSLYSKAIVSRAVAEPNKIFFRSSDIEFWSIDSENDLKSIFSSKYLGMDGEDGDVNPELGYADGQSLEYILGDETESVVFTPYSDYTTILGNGLNDDWATDASAFISAGKTKINLVRLDIGGGGISFKVDGQTRKILRADGSSSECTFTLTELESAYASAEITEEEYNVYLDVYNTYSGIDANSIFFIDKQFLSKPVLVERDLQEKLILGSISASDLNVTDSEFSFLRTLFSNNNYIDAVTMIDVDGALCVPLEPVDISQFDSSVNSLVIEISWNIANSIHVRNGEYFMDNRVGNTSLDFRVALKVD